MLFLRTNYRFKWYTSRAKLFLRYFALYICVIYVYNIMYETLNWSKSQSFTMIIIFRWIYWSTNPHKQRVAALSNLYKFYITTIIILCSENVIDIILELRYGHGFTGAKSRQRTLQRRMKMLSGEVANIYICIYINTCTMYIL